MKTFRIYKHDTAGLAAVKAGVSWPALFFGFMWMVAHKFWGRAGLWLVISLWILQFRARPDLFGIPVNDPPRDLVFAACWFALNSICFVKGNRWREARLKDSGYELLEPASAETEDEALSRMRAKISVLADRELLSKTGGSVPVSLDTSGRINPTKPQTPHRDTPEGRANEVRLRWSGPSD
jgi:hypothetical protein